MGDRSEWRGRAEPEQRIPERYESLMEIGDGCEDTMRGHPLICTDCGNHIWVELKFVVRDWRGEIIRRYYSHRCQDAEGHPGCQTYAAEYARAKMGLLPGDPVPPIGDPRWKLARTPLGPLTGHLAQAMADAGMPIPGTGI